MADDEDKTQPQLRPLDDDDPPAEGTDANGVTTAFDLEAIRAASAAGDGTKVPALIALAGNQIGMAISLIRLPLVFGRGEDCDVILTGRGVSRHHFRVERQGTRGAPAIVDLGSTNGVHVNGALVQRHTLTDGDRIQLGPGTTFRFGYESGPEIDIRRRRYEQAIRDHLTGAFNRRHFEMVLQHEHAYARRHDEALSVLLVDLDHFKRINDAHGHEAGDRVLQRVTAVLAEHLRSEDLLARYGGEEFAVLLRGQDPAGALETAERLRRMLAEQRFAAGGVRIPVTTSVGVASLDPAGEDSALDLVRIADKRLYEAKSAGRNRCVGDPGAARPRP